METLVSDASSPSDEDEHYHDAREHGLIWALLNEMLHLIVLLFTLFGMIRFKVKFIHMVKLVKLVSTLVIIHSWYISIKFALIATSMYFFNLELEATELPWSAFNCSLENTDRVLLTYIERDVTVISSVAVDSLPWLRQQQQQQQQYLANKGYYILFLSDVLQVLGGPFKMLGNRATLMYGFYSVALLIMLAIFPIELMYLNIGFNYIRFVLNDTGCLKELYDKRQKHLDRLNNWSRNKNKSVLTLSMKKITNQRDLRSSYLFDSRRGTAEQLIINHLENIRHERSPSTLKPPLVGVGRVNKRQFQQLDNVVEEKFMAPLRSLKHSLSVNHSDKPSYSVLVANKNLRKFKPLVRSGNWFIISMVVYPIFIFFYFILLTFIIGAVSKYFNEALALTDRVCRDEVDPKMDLYANWTLLDQITFLETHYTVFSLSCASCFYCSYYFGTIMELHMWIQEISQQLNLCKLSLELTSNKSPISSSMLTIQASSLSQYGLDTVNLANYNTRSPAPPEATSPLIEALTAYYNIDSQLVDRCFNQFGGLNCLYGHLNFSFAPQSEKFKRREYMAWKLMFKKQTILRATYINMNLFFDELNDTRFMITTILKRTTQIVFGFALLVGITRSQFKSNYLYLTSLLAAGLAILNLYLICAASINSTVNKLLPQIHGIISASIMAGADHDLLEFWLRHIQAYGTDKDAMSYKIYGYKITWSSILNFNGAVSSAYLFTVY